MTRTCPLSYVKRIKKTQCVVVQLEGFAALALAFVPPSWLEELTEEAYREAMQVARE